MKCGRQQTIHRQPRGRQGQATCRRISGPYRL